MFQRPLLVSSLAFLAMLAMGTAGYMWIEGWRALDAFWMVAITLTTIGFGEIHTLSDNGRVFTLGLILAGVSIGTYAMAQITQQVVEGKMSAAILARQRRRRLEALKDHYIVVGYGRLGETIVEELRASGMQVCIIEKHPGSLARLEASGLPVVQGDGSNDDVLRRAGILTAKGMAVAVSSSAESVFVTLSARSLNAKLNIVTRVSDAENALKARRVGATSVVSPHTMGGWRMAHGLVRPHTSSFLDLATLATHADILLEEYEIPENCALVGKSLGSLRLGEQLGVLIVAIRRTDGRMIATPHASEILGAGDVLIAIGAPAKVQKLGALMVVRPESVPGG